MKLICSTAIFASILAAVSARYAPPASPSTIGPPVPTPAEMAIDCPESDNDWFADPINKCSGIFFLNIQSIGIRFDCPANMYFDKETNMCEGFENVADCTGEKKSIILEPSETLGSATTLEPASTQEPSTLVEPTTTEEPSTFQAPTATPEPSAQEPSTTVEPTTTEEPSPNQGPTTTQETTTSQEPATIQEQTTLLESATTQGSATTQEQTTSQKATTSQEPTTTQEETAAPELIPTEVPTTSQEATRRQEPSTTRGTTATQEPTLPLETTTIQEAASTSQEPTKPTTAPEPTTTQEPTTTRGPVSTQTQQPTTEKSEPPTPEPTTLEPSPASLPPVEFDCEGKKDGGYTPLDSKCSNIYFKCARGVASKFVCPDGLFYDIENDRCDQRSNLFVCSDENQGPIAPITTKKPRFMWKTTWIDEGCKGNHALFQRHPSDCRKFRRCVFGRQIDQDCPDGLVFNVKLLTCDYPSAVPECDV